MVRGLRDWGTGLPSGRLAQRKSTCGEPQLSGYTPRGRLKEEDEMGLSGQGGHLLQVTSWPGSA